MIVDYHMHLRNEREEIDHRVETVERWVESALSRGIDEIGFTEHVYYFRETRELWHVPYHVERCAYPIEPYVEAVLEAKRRGLPVKLGLEVDYEPAREERTRELLAQYPWDYLLGSVHFVDGDPVDARPGLGGEDGWRRYFAALARLARSGLVDVLAHPDLVKIFGDRRAWDWSDLVDSLDGVCLEVSSAGLHKPVGELYPEASLLRAARERGVGITLASDAHVPEHVGRDLERAIAHAREAGYETVTVFDGRVARQELLA